MKLKIKRLGNGRIAWAAVLADAKRGDWMLVPHVEMHNARVALHRHKANTPGFDYTTKITQDGLRLEVLAA